MKTTQKNKMRILPLLGLFLLSFGGCSDERVIGPTETSSQEKTNQPDKESVKDTETEKEAAPAKTEDEASSTEINVTSLWDTFDENDLPTEKTYYLISQARPQILTGADMTDVENAVLRVSYFTTTNLYEADDVFSNLSDYLFENNQAEELKALAAVETKIKEQPFFKLEEKVIKTESALAMAQQAREELRFFHFGAKKVADKSIQNVQSHLFKAIKERDAYYEANASEIEKNKDLLEMIESRRLAITPELDPLPDDSVIEN